MYFLLYITLAVGVYAGTFKNDFNEEDINKALPFLAICGIAALALSIIGSI